VWRRRQRQVQVHKSVIWPLNNSYSRPSTHRPTAHRAAARYRPKSSGSRTGSPSSPCYDDTIISTCLTYFANAINELQFQVKLCSYLIPLLLSLRVHVSDTFPGCIRTNLRTNLRRTRRATFYRTLIISCLRVWPNQTMTLSCTG
jgi:hypothetical protein